MSSTQNYEGNKENFQVRDNLTLPNYLNQLSKAKMNVISYEELILSKRKDHAVRKHQFAVCLLSTSETHFSK